MADNQEQESITKALLNTPAAMAEIGANPHNAHNISSASCDTKPPKGGYQLSPYRWVIWVFFTFQQIGSGISMVGFTAISPLLKDLFNVNSFVISLLVLSFTIAYIPFNFPANKLIENSGITWPIRISWVSIFIGAWIRMLYTQSFYFILAGQCIMALGNPFVMTIGAKIAAIWFGDNERALATTITSIAHVMGVMIGFVYPIIFVNDSDINNPKRAKDKLGFYILIQSITVTVVSIPIFFLIKNLPEHPPSHSARVMRRGKKTQIMKAVKKLMVQRNILILYIAFSLIFSLYIVLGASVGLISDEYHYSSENNSLFGAVVIFWGLIGSVLHAVILDKFRRYKYQLIFIGISTVLSITLVILIIDRQTLYITTISLGILGASVVPIIGVGYSFWAEVAYPIGEAMSWGVMQVVSSIISTLITLAFNIVLDKFGGTTALISLGGVVVVGTIVSLFVVEHLNKSNLKLRVYSSTFSISLVPDVPEDEDEMPYDERDPLDKSLRDAMMNASKNTLKSQKLSSL